ncbi:MAG: T9SS type A sorting domain-containing protein [Ignavibacteriales bacterium]|nr:T9SS type A sorting domain-containing protein [Ignavibacteriales bacterium]
MNGIWRRASYPDANNIIAVSDGGLIIRTTDGGNSWESQFSGTKNWLTGVSFIDKNIGWVVGAFGTILHTTNGGVTFIEDEENNFTQPKEFLLQQNYPNPFNPSTSIQYAISSMQFVTLKVYDLLGREVATLVNEEKTIGSYEVEFYGNNLTSGIYFYKLQAGSFVETKKMVLIK